MNIAIIGATGNVGRKILEVLEKLNFEFEFIWKMIIKLLVLVMMTGVIIAQIDVPGHDPKACAKVGNWLIRGHPL